MFPRLEEFHPRLRCDGQLIIRKRCREATQAVIECSNLSCISLFYYVQSLSLCSRKKKHQFNTSTASWQHVFQLNVSSEQFPVARTRCPLTSSLTNWPLNSYVHGSLNQAAAHTPNSSGYWSEVEHSAFFPETNVYFKLQTTWLKTRTKQEHE